MNWYFDVLKKYAVFEGRARRKVFFVQDSQPDNKYGPSPKTVAA